MNHLAFDLLAYAIAVALTWWVRSRARGPAAQTLPRQLRGGYLIAATHGVVLGGVALGSLNLYLGGQTWVLGKSILGALVGGIVAVELFKIRHGLRGSTGVWLVPGIAMGIVIGRVGCFMAGLDDHTYGIPASVSWAVDHGDGVPRHPVALYEAAALLPVAGYALWATLRQRPGWMRHGFYLFALYYGLQRFVWEFLKPYAEVALGLNLFQWLCLALIGYGLFMLRGTAPRNWAPAS